MKYEPTMVDETSGAEVPNPLYQAYMEGIKEGRKQLAREFEPILTMMISDITEQSERMVRLLEAPTL